MNIVGYRLRIACADKKSMSGSGDSREHKTCIVLVQILCKTRR